MIASELIAALQEAIKEYGDFEVENDSKPVGAITYGRCEVDGKPEDTLYLT